MIKLIKSLPFHINTAFKSIGRHLAMTFSASSAVSITLFLVALFIVAAGNVNNFTKNIESNFRIHASIDAIATPEEVSKLKSEIEVIPEVTNVVFSSKEEEIQALVKQNHTLFSRYDNENNPLNDAFIIDVNETENLDALKEEITKLDNIESASYGGEFIFNLIDGFSTMRYGIGIFIIGLAILTILLIQNTIRITIQTRRDEIAIMRNVGVSNGFIRVPFMIEGWIIGIIGALFPMLIILLGYQYLYSSLGGQFASGMFTLLPTFPFIGYICLGILGIGMIVGLFGSFLAVNKNLRWKR